jgi:hypothetical protein
MITKAQIERWQTPNAHARALFIGVTDTMCNLYARWLDEREYEDIADYAAIVKPRVTEIGGTFVRMTKRPFGFVYTLDGITYTVTINMRGYKYTSNRPSVLAAALRANQPARARAR